MARLRDAGPESVKPATLYPALTRLREEGGGGGGAGEGGRGRKYSASPRRGGSD
ncbi:hypothetical protein ACF1G5_17610 [Streptomyces coeruleorubidus]|uniref:hypothetical protein n=1 Tax=Streptomyces coeruleorubidus TaxID=116188 RepID=UPI0036F6534F